MSYISTEINPQQASHDLDTVRGALGHIARSSSGDGFYFFIWGALIAIVLPLVGWMPSAVTAWLAAVLYLGGWWATAAGAMRQRRSNRYGGDWRGFIFWMVIAAESFLFSFLFTWGQAVGFQPGFLDIVNILLFALGLITIGAFSDMRISLIGFAAIIVALILPALLPSGGNRLALSGLLIGGCYILAGWFIYQSGLATEVIEKGNNPPGQPTLPR